MGLKGVTIYLGTKRKKQWGMEMSVDIPIVFWIQVEHG